MKKKNRIAVIGGGVSGMTAAVTAAEQGADVLLLEQKEMTGKKILVTGNGRCNYTNRVQTPQCYRSDDPEFPWKVMQKFPAEKILELFQEMGIYPKDRNGYIYPKFRSGFFCGRDFAGRTGEDRCGGAYRCPLPGDPQRKKWI